MKQIDELRRFMASLNTRTMKKTRTPKMPKHSPIFHGRDSLFHSLLTPDRIINRVDTLQLGEEHHAFIAAKGYPGSLQHNWLARIVDDIDETNLNFSQFITPIENDKAVKELQEHITTLDTEIKLRMLEDSPVPVTTYEKLTSATDRLKTLTKGTEKSFDLANYFSVHDANERTLNRAIASLKSTIAGLMILPTRLYFRGMEGYQCMMPIGIDPIQMTRHMDTTAVARSMALPGRARISAGSGGSIIGVEYETGIPIIFDKFDRSLMNANVVLMAGSGRGKTFWASLDIAHQVEMGNDVVIIDPKKEYGNLVEEFKGTNIIIREGSDTCLNPFTLGAGPDDTLTSKKQELPTFVSIMVGGVSEAAKSILMTCIDQMYFDKGIIEGDRDTWNIEPPIMSDLYQTILDYINGKVETEIEVQHSDKVAATTLLKDIKPFATGAFKSFFNGSTNIDMQSHLINYDISGVPESIRDAVMYLILANNYDYMIARERGYRSVYMDEAWALLASNSEYIKKIVKTCRGFNMSIVIITQDLDDVVGSSAGHAIIGNTAIKIILGMETAYAQEVGKLVGLTPSEAGTLTSTGKGEGFLIVNSVATRFKTPSAPAEKKLIESSTIAKGNSEQFDTTEKFYVCKDLTQQQIGTLVNLKFERTPGKKLGRGTADYMVRNETKNQSDEHFIMTHLIARAAKNLGLTTEIHDYGKDFDVTVRNSFGLIIGFEVETGKNNWSDVIAKADRLNNPSEQLEAKEWYFVTPSAMTKKYAQVNSNTVTGGQIDSLLRNLADAKPDIAVESDDQL